MREIIHKLMSADSQDEVDNLVAEYIDDILDNPALERYVKNARHRINTIERLAKPQYQN